MQAFNWQEYKEILGSRGIIGLDLETTGINRNIEYERPTSAAILEANNDLNNPEIIINDKCRLPYHVLPDAGALNITNICLLYTSPSPRDKRQSRMPSSA